MFGAQTEEALNSVPMSETYVDPEDLERLGARFDEEGALDAVEVRRRRLDGRLVWLLMDSRLVEFEGESAALVWHYDITARKEAEETLARQAETLEQTVARDPRTTGERKPVEFDLRPSARGGLDQGFRIASGKDESGLSSVVRHRFRIQDRGE
ncbi:PAS domain S-box protein [Thalassospiraceae bacterium LMO-SO8]|nr:PAS domain S-box protein [Thalassospiraceae bacterium LMO-SO8]